MKGMDSTFCKNCNHIISGKYCWNCGQKLIGPEDKKIKHFVEEFFSSLFVADGKVLLTFKLLFTKPGALTKSFINGATKKYLSPLKLFFFANLIYFLVPFLNTFSTDLGVQLKYQVYSEFAKDLVENHISKNRMKLIRLSLKKDLTT